MLFSFEVEKRSTSALNCEYNNKIIVNKVRNRRGRDVRRGEERKSTGTGEEKQGKRRDPGAGGPISDYLVPGLAKTVSWPEYYYPIT